MKDYYLQYDDKNGAINHIIANALKCYFEYENQYFLLIESICGFIEKDFDRIRYEALSDILKIIEGSTCFASRVIPIVAGIYTDIKRHFKSKPLFTTNDQHLFINDEEDYVYFISILAYSARYSILTYDSDMSIGHFIIENYQKLSVIARYKLAIEIEDVLKRCVIEQGYDSELIRFWFKTYTLLNDNNFE